MPAKRIEKLVTIAISIGFAIQFLFVFLGLNFGTVSSEQLFSFLALGQSGLQGADVVVQFEFTLLVIAVPILIAWTYISSRLRRGLKIRVGLGLVLFSFTSSAVSAGVVMGPSLVLDQGSEETAKQEVIGNLEISNDRTANVLHIYVEALSYDLGYEFPENESPSKIIMEALGEQGQSLSLPSGPLATTIDGLAAAMCGFSSPPEGYLDPDSNVWLLKDFDCVSDALSRNGYKNVFLGAASSEFQSKGDFLSSHSFSVFDKENWTSLGASELTSWGQTIHDDALFDYARVITTNLIVEKKPFNLNILTLDTHYPYYLPESCTSEYEWSAPGVFSCSTMQIKQYISWYTDYTSDPTLIIVQGDHPDPKSPKQDEEVFFAFACHGVMKEEIAPPKNYSEIANFTLSAANSCSNVEETR